MTAPRWYLRPSVLLSAVSGLIVLTAVLTPEREAGRGGDERLTTYSTASMGARLLHDLAARLGWRVARDTASGGAALADPRAIQAILAPADPPSAIETHAILERVRRGGALLYAIAADGDDTPLDDSLHVRRGPGGPIVSGGDTTGTIDEEDVAIVIGAPVPVAAPPGRRASADSTCRRHPGFGGAVPLWPGSPALLNQLLWTGPPPGGADTVVFLRSGVRVGPGGRTVVRAAAAGFALGAGRVVVVADPDAFRTDAMRVCRYGLDVAAVRMLEYLSAGAGAPRDRVVFDEYHQGFGTHPGTVRAMTLYLRGTPSGRMLAQWLVAGLVLLLALGPRAVPPRDAVREERRSPLEHADALALAYEQVGATRTAAARLLRGVRRRTDPSRHLAAWRHATSGSSPTTDEAWLDWAATVAPEHAADLALVRRALATPLERRDFTRVGEALASIERSLMKDRSRLSALGSRPYGRSAAAPPEPGAESASSQDTT